MRKTATTFLATRPLPTGWLWFALGMAWLACLGAVLLRQTPLAALLATAGLVLVATLGLAPIRKAFAGEQRKITSLLNSAPEGILEIDAAGTIVFVNPQLCELFGYQPQELLGQAVEILVPAGVRGGHAARRTAFATSSRSRSMGSGLDISGVRKDGSLIAVDVSLNRIETRHGAVMYCMVRDNSARKTFEKQLLESNRQLTDSVAALERHSMALQTLTGMGELLHSSDTEQELYEIVAHTMGRLFPDLSGVLYMLGDSRNAATAICSWGDDAPSFKASIQREDCWALRRGRAHLTATPADAPRCSHHTGAVPYGSHCVPLMGHGQLSGVLHLSRAGSSGDAGLGAPAHQQLLQALANQIALSLANLRLRENLREQGATDPLTGLGNRRVLDQRFDEEMVHAREEGRDLALLILDIDHFKSFNDRFGHGCGDLALREVGKLMRAILRRGDVVCRMGGEEFAILLPGTSLVEAEAVAEKLRAAIEDLRLQSEGRQLARISISIGIAMLGVHGDSAEALTRQADRALYRAKAAGRNRVVVANLRDDTGLYVLPPQVPRQA